MMRWSSGTLPSQRMAAAASQSVLSFGSATLISSNCWIRASACADVAGSGASSAWTSLRRVVLNLSNDSSGCVPGGPRRWPRWMGSVTRRTSTSATFAGMLAGGVHTVHHGVPLVWGAMRMLATVPRLRRQRMWYHRTHRVQYRNTCNSGWYTLFTLQLSLSQIRLPCCHAPHSQMRVSCDAVLWGTYVLNLEERRARRMDHPGHGDVVAQPARVVPKYGQAGLLGLKSHDACAQLQQVRHVHHFDEIPKDKLVPALNQPYRLGGPRAHRNRRRFQVFTRVQCPHLHKRLLICSSALGPHGHVRSPAHQVFLPALHRLDDDRIVVDGVLRPVVPRTTHAHANEGGNRSVWGRVQDAALMRRLTQCPCGFRIRRGLHSVPVSVGAHMEWVSTLTDVEGHRNGALFHGS